METDDFFHRALEDLEKKSIEEQPEMEKHARDTQFIRVKSKEYRSQVQKLEVPTRPAQSFSTVF